MERDSSASLTAGQPSSISSDMLRNICAGSDETWRRFADKYSPLVYHWCRRAALQPADAAEVTQETFVAVWQHASRFSRAEADSTFRGWLWTITHRKICDLLRRRGRWVAFDDVRGLSPPVSEELNSSSLLAAPTSSRLTQALEAVQAMVEPRSWQAFWLTAVELQSCDDVAKSLQMSPAAVRQAKYRTLRHLRTWLSSQAATDSVENV